MSTAVIPEPIAQLQRQLDEIRTAPNHWGSCRIPVWQAKPSNWPGNTVCIPSHTRYGWTIRG